MYQISQLYETEIVENMAYRLDESPFFVFPKFVTQFNCAVNIYFSLIGSKNK